MADVQILQCPSCKEYIASDAERCRFCSRPLDAQTKQTAAAALQKDNKRYRRSHYLKYMLTGAGVFAVGVVITVGTIAMAASSEGGGHFVVTWGLMLVGAGNFLYGLIGIIGETFSK
ncbi:MAG TPA: hypothetical protein VFA21_18340 [Pyrinomonadaceae bacterium]|jgi:hypothetical protein|nr:hypothetical protein [Pyrinomonadaceae bacterium]